MYHVTIRFYEELNDFLRKENRKKETVLSFPGRRSVKDLIESLGVPHVEVDLILINGESMDFSYIIRDGDRISVYPVFESLNIENVTRLRPSPLRDTKFVLDVHLGRLARRLRLLGFDVDYTVDRDDHVLAEIAYKENRVLLTRDRQLLMRKTVSRGIIIRNTDSEKQVLEVLDRLDLWSACRPFTRCINCNGLVSTCVLCRDELEEKVPEGVLAWCHEFYQCSRCENIYWKGSHFGKLEAAVERIMRSRPS